MRYQVPQFIEVEDKIFGPFTLRQFIYLAGGGGLCLILFTLLPFWLAAALAVPVVALAAGLAFYQVNGRPFIIVLEHGFMYLVGNKLYLWKQRRPEASRDELLASSGSKLAPSASQLVPKLSESKLKDLAWSLNIKDRSQQSGGGAGQGDFAV